MLFGFRGIAVSEPTIYMRWIFLPVIAHWLSWLTGMAGVVLFPVLLTIAQVLILKVYSEAVKPWWWLATLPVTFGCWIYFGPHRYDSAVDPEGYFIRAILIYYIVQCLNSFFLPLVVKENPVPAMIRWFGSVLIAGVCWVIFYYILIRIVPLKTILGYQNWWFGMLLVFPLISLLANALGGLYLIRVRERAHVW
ncbi:hypothetical protein [Arsenicibacter rosenii]|nr:hypothetical protein [Arsenicibacter rosenii]